MTAAKKREGTVGTVGTYIMIALIGAGAAYSVANRGKPRPGVSSGQKKVLVACGAVIVVGLLLLLAVVLISQGSPRHH